MNKFGPTLMMPRLRAKISPRPTSPRERSKPMMIPAMAPPLSPPPEMNKYRVQGTLRKLAKQEVKVSVLINWRNLLLDTTLSKIMLEYKVFKIKAILRVEETEKWSYSKEPQTFASHLTIPLTDLRCTYIKSTAISEHKV